MDNDVTSGSTLELPITEWLLLLSSLGNTVAYGLHNPGAPPQAFEGDEPHGPQLILGAGDGSSQASAAAELRALVEVCHAPSHTLFLETYDRDRVSSARVFFFRDHRIVEQTRRGRSSVHLRRVDGRTALIEDIQGILRIPADALPLVDALRLPAETLSRVRSITLQGESREAEEALTHEGLSDETATVVARVFRTVVFSASLAFVSSNTAVSTPAARGFCVLSGPEGALMLKPSRTGERESVEIHPADAERIAAELQGLLP